MSLGILLDVEEKLQQSIWSSLELEFVRSWKIKKKEPARYAFLKGK